MRKYLSILAGLLFAGVVLAQKGERNMNNQAYNPKKLSIIT